MNDPQAEGHMASHIERRKFLATLGGAAAWPLAAHAQQPGRVWRIGVLETTSMALNAANFEAFRQSLRDLGYIENQNLIIEYRSAEGRSERFADLAADLLRLNIDVIVTRGTPAVLAAKKAKTTTHIVMAATGDPLMVVASLANPGGEYYRLKRLYHWPRRETCRGPQGIGPRRCAGRRPLQHGQPRSPSAVERAANSGKKTGAYAAAAGHTKGRRHRACIR